MTPPKKPEWIELSEGDSPAFRPAKNKRTSFIFLSTLLMVSFGGVLVAQSPEESPAIADEMQIAQGVQPVSSPATSPAKSPAKIALLALPTNSYDEDEDADEYGDDEDEDDDEYEDD